MATFGFTGSSFRPMGHPDYRIMPIFGGGGGNSDIGYVYQQQKDKRDYEAQRQRDAAQFGYQSSLAAQQQQGRMAELQAQLAMQRHVADQQAAIARQQQQFQQNKFNRVWNTTVPFLQKGMEWQSGYQGSGQVGNEVPITTSPIWTNQQIQERVNAQRAQADAGTQSQLRKMQGDFSGRGYSANSPLAQAFMSQALMSNLANNAALEQQTRWGAAEGNAGHLLKSQIARENQFANRQNEEIERNKVYRSYLASVLGSLMGMA